jgi:hypothetical protein
MDQPRLTKLKKTRRQKITRRQQNTYRYNPDAGNELEHIFIAPKDAHESPLAHQHMPEALSLTRQTCRYLDSLLISKGNRHAFLQPALKLVRTATI